MQSPNDTSCANHWRAARPSYVLPHLDTTKPTCITSCISIVAFIYIYIYIYIYKTAAFLVYATVSCACICLHMPIHVTKSVLTGENTGQNFRIYRAFTGQIITKIAWATETCSISFCVIDFLSLSSASLTNASAVFKTTCRFPCSSLSWASNLSVFCFAALIVSLLFLHLL